MIVSGFCHLARSSAKHDASVELLLDGRLRIMTEQGQQELPLAELEISEPLGDLPVKLVFPDGMQFIPHDSRLLESALHYRQSARLHRVERSLPLIVGSLVAMVLLFVVFFTHGIPWLSGVLARGMPTQVSVVVGEHVLSTLDEHLLDPTELSIEQQASINQRFTDMTAQLPQLPVPPKLLFRSWGAGPNAMALSDGSVIVFDALVDLAETPEQLDSILLHELGHVQHQHIMKSLVRSTLLSASVAVLTGESTGLIDTFSGAGVFLATQGYSRSAEQEADAYAASQMKRLYGTVLPMQQMFRLLNTTEGNGELPEWLSTHPELKSRIEALTE
ncbi:M48 family metallopeptidase [Photobacterium sp. SDRW27]|uniref:M48 family metallopeptidase n=1 Tax=Photobacterium obscurum TaxID=2829490 RepID=UPI0022444906|nr:M48 family metallopeptidase [Photobacterium obscurum]MCW8330377.1 M48 family metallopeptidase [Photobacterium obscurum]